MMAMFGNQNAWMRGLPPSIMQDYMRDPRLLHAQAAMKDGGDMSPVQTPLQGLARALQGVVGGLQQKRLRDEYSSRANDYQKTLADALGAKSPPVMEDAPETGGITGDDRIARMAAILAGNPDTANLGFQIQMQDVLGQAKDERALMAARERMKLEAPKSRTLKRNGVEVTEQWNPATQSFEVVGESGIGIVSPEAEAQKARIAKAGKSETNINVDLSKGQAEADKKAAADYNQFILQGGAADMQKNIAQLRVVRDALRTSDNLTGPFLGMLPKSVRAAINPASVNTQELVEEVVQRNLREVLGAQFTEKEGERLIARAYNVQLDEKTNAARLERLLGAIEKAHEAKIAAAQYFEQNGTLKGYPGTTRFTIQDIEREAGLAPKAEPAESGGIKFLGFE